MPPAPPAAPVPPAPSVPRVLACGLTTLDVRQTVERVPGPDEKVVAHDLAVEVGGPAANAATTCTALGVPARLLTRVGGATVGRIASEDLTRHAVEVVDLAGPDDAPAVSTVLVTAATGQRAVASVNATRQTASSTDDAELLAAAHAALDGVTAVLVDGHHLDLAVPVAAAARARGVVVVLDGGSWKPGLERLLAQVDVAVLSADFRLPDDVAVDADDVPPTDEVAVEPEARRADLLNRVGALGPTVVAQSHGADPVQVRHPGGHAQLPVPRVRAVDTLGAGDVLHGAVVAWLACVAAADASPGADDPVAAAPGDPRRAVGAPETLDALAFATQVAASSVTAPGARGWAADAAVVARAREQLVHARPAMG